MTSEGLASWIVDNMNKIPKRRGMVGNLAILKNWSLGIVVLDNRYRDHSGLFYLIDIFL